jgi:hypothetical protein
MNAFPASVPGFEIDVAPALKVYMDGLETWKESYQRFFQPPMSGPPAAANMSASPQGEAIGELHRTGEALFRQFVERQAELCRFFGHRWEQYRDMPEKLARCRTPAEIGELQLDFLGRMATDYAQIGAKLSPSARG